MLGRKPSHSEAISLASMNNLASVLRDKGKYEQAA
jgi:hypothetical protein